MTLEQKKQYINNEIFKELNICINYYRSEMLTHDRLLENLSRIMDKYVDKFEDDAKKKLNTIKRLIEDE